MRERLATTFPLILSAIVPLAGLLLALAKFTQGERREGGALLAAAVLGAVVWSLVLSA